NAGASGMIFVGAAGNSAADADTSPMFPSANDITRVISTQTWPGLSNILSVAATDSTGKLAWFSNFGATSVHLGTPAVSVFSTVPGGYGFKSGTSMATPHVTGVIGLLYATYPNLTVSQAISRVLNFTTPDSNLTGQTVTGGLLNAAATIAPPPVLDSVQD